MKMTEKYKFLEVRKLETLNELENWLLKGAYSKINMLTQSKNGSKTWKQLIDSNTGIIYVAKDNENFIGMIAGLLTPNLYDVEQTDSFIAAIYVDDNYKEKSIGKKLYELFEKWSKLNKATKILAGVFLDSGKMFFEKQGFKELQTILYKEGN